VNDDGAGIGPITPATATMWSSWTVITPIRRPSLCLTMAISQDRYRRRATKTTV
jgi:hypothetical protein